jgi:ABC-type polar amino acid transport system ATPase subunit
VPAIVRLEAVYQRYHSTAALNGIDFSVEAGEVVAIIGPSGSGKSTLLRVISRLVPVVSGRVMVDGIEVHNANPDLKRLHQTVGMVFQSYNLFPHMTVLRNITLGLTEVLRMKRDKAEGIARKFLASFRRKIQILAEK